MATKTKPHAAKPVPTKRVVATNANMPAIAGQVVEMMDYLKALHSPSQAQMHLQELLQKVPPDMPRYERQLRITALKQLGYSDLTKRGPYPENQLQADDDD